MNDFTYIALDGQRVLAVRKDEDLSICGFWLANGKSMSSSTAMGHILRGNCANLKISSGPSGQSIKCSSPADENLERFPTF